MELVLDEVTRQRTHAKKHERAMWVTVSVGLLAVAALMGGLFAITLVGNELSKDVRPDQHGELHTLNSNEHVVVRTAKVMSYGTLAGLPCQSSAFLAELRELLLVVDGVTRKYTIDNFEWKDASHMVLYTTLHQSASGQPHTIVIRDGLAWVDFGDGRLGHIEMAPAVAARRELGVSAAPPRKLADLVHPARHLSPVLASEPTRTFTWDELLSVHREHVAAALGLSQRRQASEATAAGSAGGGEALYDLYRFFGGIVGSETPTTAEVDHEAASTCAAALAASVRRAPLPDVPLRSRWTTTRNGDENMTWFMDLRTLSAPRFHMISDKAGTRQHEIAAEGRRSTYWTWDPTYANDGAAFAPELVNASAASKGGCVNERFDVDSAASGGGASPEVAADALTTTVTLHQQHVDGSAVWRVNGWLVMVSPTGMVTKIADIAVTSIEALLVGERIGGVELFGHCVPGEEPMHLVPALRAALAQSGYEPTTATGAATGVGTGTGTGTGGNGGERRRMFGSWTDFQNWASGTNWCGAGTDNYRTVCPTPSNSADYDADRACRRHDHASKASSVWGGIASRLSCDVDKDLAGATANRVVQAVFGAGGVAQLWGCFDFGSYGCWKWKSKWWGGYWYRGSCTGEQVKYGSDRYNAIRHRYGYTAKAKTCHGDIW